MSLILSLGTNLGDKNKNILLCIERLNDYFGKPVSISRIYESEPYGPVSQDSFYNMCVEYALPSHTPQNVMQTCLNIEEEMGRTREIKWGPRIIDIDILYFGLKKIKSDLITLPHPHIADRSFVVLPLKELTYFDTLRDHFEYPSQFTTQSYPVASLSIC